MPPASSAAAKKQPLTLEQISKYDDILTDCLVDQVGSLQAAAAWGATVLTHD